MPKKKINNYLGRNFKKTRENDKISNEHRSELMSKITSQNTKFELDFINLLKRSILNRFKTHDVSLKGKPDIVFQKEKLCIFLDSDFWHGWQYPRWRHLLKNDFWKEKINNNRNRDIKTTRFLRKRGWKVLRIWEHKYKCQPNEVIQLINQALYEK
ncbi:very short patch repair endonuclease [Patescibacteria group bacterium]|nr:very short patch repair endonuclease [Patescibacteria group bacterium]